MQSYAEDNEFGGSANGSSDDDPNEQTEELEDADAEVFGEDEEEVENEEEEVMDEDDGGGQEPGIAQAFYRNSSAQKEDNQSLSSQPSAAKSIDVSDNLAPLGATATAPTSHPRANIFSMSPSQQQHTSSLVAATSIDLPKVRAEALTAPVYDIAPTIAAPHSTSINAITATPDLRWVFSGGTDGYIRKFNWVETVNAKVMLTVAQRHPFVDSVTKAGVLTSYWENEEPQLKSGDDGPSLSSVYSLAVHHQALWLLSGLESGGINLQSVRHDEGKRITCLKKHTSAVSVLTLAQDEKSVLSGSWDKTVLDWDLNTGQVKRSFEGSAGQISALEMRPLSSSPIAEALPDQTTTNDTFSSNNADKPHAVDTLKNGIKHEIPMETLAPENGHAAVPGSPADSSYADSLFGDNDEDPSGSPPGDNFADDDDDDFSRAIANGMQQQENEDAQGDISMLGTGTAEDQPHTNGALQHQEDGGLLGNGTSASTPGVDNPVFALNRFPHAEEIRSPKVHDESVASASAITQTADSTFLTASIDGSLRVWDKRKPTPVVKILPRNVPPWCMNACWSPDGNFIYAGRRNGCVEEFSVHKGLRGVERTFKFPNGSGAVSAVRAMPNGRHLICASHDILRLYDLHQQQSFKHSTVPFLIVPGHRTGVVSQLYIDPSCRFMISTAGNRGWEGNSTEVLLGYEIGIGT